MKIGPREHPPDLMQTLRRLPHVPLMASFGLGLGQKAKTSLFLVAMALYTGSPTLVFMLGTTGPFSKGVR